MVAFIIMNILKLNTPTLNTKVFCMILFVFRIPFRLAVGSEYTISYLKDRN